MESSSIKMSDLKSYDALKCLWAIWKFLCIKPWPKYQKLKLVFLIFTVFLTISHLLALNLGLLLSGSTRTAVQNFPFNIGFFACSVKFACVYSMRSELLELEKYFDQLDDILKSEEERAAMRVLADKVHRYSIAYVSFDLSIAASGIIVSLASAGQNLIFPAWYPFNYRENGWKFALAFTHQLVAFVVLNFQNISSDGYPMCYLVMLNAHVKVLIRRFSTIGKDETDNSPDNYPLLVSCVQNHVIILNILSILRKLISQTLFVEFIVSSGIQCFTVVYLISFDLPTVEKIFFISCAFGSVMEILPTCYVANQLIQLTEDLAFAAYSANWVYQGTKFRRTIVFIMAKCQEPSVILAGGIVPVTMATFLSIVKFSYSLLTLMIGRLQR
ncbi:odorant receptor 33a-like [Hermetia illucens]|uniref:odorant receptor 33a-like n=1 Tax=Hermetia illucens TaxID=343691 RepID=UPI0018CC252C|nr:odorant receptor 33a-like [Hermetia illucens]